MRAKCPSCENTGEYEKSPAECQSCGRFVKLIQVEEIATDSSIKTEQDADKAAEQKLE